MQKQVLGVALAAGALLGACSVPPLRDNDTGGIIAWSPEAHARRHEIAAAECARYGKRHRITSVHPRYGDYIAFACYWPRGYDPHRIVVHRSY